MVSKAPAQAGWASPHIEVVDEGVVQLRAECALCVLLGLQRCAFLGTLLFLLYRYSLHIAATRYNPQIYIRHGQQSTACDNTHAHTHARTSFRILS